MSQLQILLDSIQVPDFRQPQQFPRSDRVKLCDLADQFWTWNLATCLDPYDVAWAFINFFGELPDRQIAISSEFPQSNSQVGHLTALVLFTESGKHDIEC